MMKIIFGFSDTAFLDFASSERPPQPAKKNEKKIAAKAGVIIENRGLFIKFGVGIVDKKR
jgi:hypothetical protein